MEVQKKKLGRTGLELSVLGFGGTGLGNMYTAMSERDAIATLQPPMRRGCATSTRRRCMDMAFPSCGWAADCAFSPTRAWWCRPRSGGG